MQRRRKILSIPHNHSRNTSRTSTLQAIPPLYTHHPPSHLSRSRNSLLLRRLPRLTARRLDRVLNRRLTIRCRGRRRRWLTLASRLRDILFRCRSRRGLGVRDGPSRSSDTPACSAEQSAQATANATGRGFAAVISDLAVGRLFFLAGEGSEEALAAFVFGGVVGVGVGGSDGGGGRGNVGARGVRMASCGGKGGCRGARWCRASGGGSGVFLGLRRC